MASHVNTTIPLADVLDILDLSPEQLSQQTGLDLDTVRRAVMGGNVKTNETTAKKIAETVGLKVKDIEWPSGLTIVGRPALTGKPIGHQPQRPTCSKPECGMELPLSGVCLCA